MQRTDHEVIIVGGGPAGAAAAAALARRQVDVCLLDKAVFPRPKLCGGLLTCKTVAAMRRIFDLAPEDLARESVLEHVTDGYAIYHRTRLLTRGSYRYPFHLVDRAALDYLLLNAARDAGAQCVTGRRVRRCDPERGGVFLEDGREMTGRWIIGADGAVSAVRRAFPGHKAPRAAWRRDLAATMQVSLDRSLAKAIDVDAPVLYAGIVRGGYGWVFPNRDTVRVGIAGLARAIRADEGVSMRSQFRNFMQMLGVPDAAWRGFDSHPLPYGNLVRSPVHGRALLAGDAGGFVEPLFGEGIYYALRTGEAAAVAVAAALAGQAGAEAVYMRALRADVYPELVYSHRLRRALYLADKYLHHLPLQVFLKSGQSRLMDMVHGLRSFRWLRKRELDFR